MSSYKQELPYFGNTLGVNANLVSDLCRMFKRAIKSPEGEEFASAIGIFISSETRDSISFQVQNVICVGIPICNFISVRFVTASHCERTSF